ncbi:MAG: hypothetical protein ABR555_01935 [Pyrinomonadaceae bacterium]
MRAAFSKTELESEIVNRFGHAFRIHEKLAKPILLTGIKSLDHLIGGLHRGAITEIFGPASSGRTSLTLSMMAHATANDEICALIDTTDAFTPTTAALSDIDLDCLLWVRCGGNIEHAFKAADLLLHAGGFGLIILDMSDVAGKDARRIISSWWYRFRRTVEDQQTAMLVLAEDSCVRSCAAVSLELNGVGEWTNTSLSLPQQGNVVPIRNLGSTGERKRVTHANVLRVNSIKINRHRPVTTNVNEAHLRVGAFEST